MGSAPASKERLLIVFIRELPASLVEEIQAKFPDYELRVHRSEKGVPIPSGRYNPSAEVLAWSLTCDSEVWHWGTILVTFHDLPEPHDAVKYAPQPIEEKKHQLIPAFLQFQTHTLRLGRCRPPDSPSLSEEHQYHGNYQLRHPRPSNRRMGRDELARRVAQLRFDL